MTFPMIVWMTQRMQMVLMCAGLVAAVQQVNGEQVGGAYRLELRAPVRTWDEGIPLGNGIMGGLLWGKDGRINLSLDRGDLWDERLPKVFSEKGWGFGNIKSLVSARNQREINRRYDNPYRQAAPTKLPGGRLVLSLSGERKAQSFGLDMASAIGSVQFGEDGLSCYFHATERVAMLRVDDPEVAARFVRPSGLNRLRYKPAVFGEAGRVNWMVQDAALGLKYAVVVASRVVGAQTELAVAIVANTEGDDPLAIGRSRVKNAIARGYGAMLESHVAWWNAFWRISSVSVPNERIQRHYNLVKYFYGSASRPESPPIPLQGVWTRDDGGLPPWKGDYHHDLNTQMTYLPYHVAGLTESGMSFINMCYNLLPTYRAFARDFFGVEGAAMASVATLAGNPTGGWVQYSFTAPNGLWVGQSFYLHWRYTMDETFLREKAYPWLNEISTGIVNMLEERDGKLYLPLSSSPEIFNNTPKAWLPPNSNYDLSLMQWAFDAMAQMCDALGKAEEAKLWRERRAKLEPLHVDERKVMKFDRVHTFDQSHRHHSHSMAIHPLGILSVDGSDEDRAVIHATLDDMKRKGTQAWTGYSFSWFAGVLARAGRADEALRYLVDYERAFILRNGFHVNGDQIGAGLSRYRYRPFTLEGNFLAMDAVHEMLLQSWSPDMGGAAVPVIRIFPAMPWAWHDASFRQLRAEGGYIVSAQRANNATVSFRIEATRDGELRVRDNFDGRVPAFKGAAMSEQGRDFVATVKAGDVIEGTLPKRSDLPPEPAVSRRMTRRKGAIQANDLPLRIGADSNGANRFTGEIARVSVIGRPLTADEIRVLADQKRGAPGALAGCIASWDFSGPAEGPVFKSKGGKETFMAKRIGPVKCVDTGSPLGKAIALSGEGYLEIAHHDRLDCLDGFTLEAWIKPGKLPAAGARIIDKSPAGAATAYLLDTYPGNSLRLIFWEPQVRAAAQLAEGKWSHVAATVDGKTGTAVLYVDGKRL